MSHYQFLTVYQYTKYGILNGSDSQSGNHGPEPVDAGPTSKKWSFEPDRTKQILKISDQFEPVGPRTWRSGNTCSQYLPLKVLTQHCRIERLIHIRGLIHFRSWIHLSAVIIQVDLTIIRKICSTVECQMVSKIESYQILY